MTKLKVDYKDYFAETIGRMCDGGLLLVTKGNNKKANIMTIGWGTIGSIWAKPIFIVLVRPSRYTYNNLDEIEEFTVNVPSKALSKAALHCGTVSGRDHDKFQDLNLTETQLPEVQVPIIEECHINYLCRSLHNNDLIPDKLNDAVKKQFYPTDDYHRIYYGEILATYADRK